MKASTVLILVGVVVVVMAASPYILGLLLAGGIAKTAGRWRRDSTERRERQLAEGALRELARPRPGYPIYGGVLNPSSRSWFDHEAGQ